MIFVDWKCQGCSARPVVKKYAANYQKPDFVHDIKMEKTFKVKILKDYLLEKWSCIRTAASVDKQVY